MATIDSGFFAWVTWFFKFIYNFMYSVNMPGFNIPILYFFIIFSLMFLIAGVFRRILFQPSGSWRSNSSSSKGGDD